MDKHKSAALEYYEAGQMSMYARLIRERRMAVDLIAKMTSWEFAKQAKKLSCSQQYISGPWELRNTREGAAFAAAEVYYAGRLSVVIRILRTHGMHYGEAAYFSDLSISQVKNLYHSESPPLEWIMAGMPGEE